MDIYNNTIVYILCPANASSGGPEALHQLCYVLRNKNIEAYMYYIPVDIKLIPNEIYSEYNCPAVLKIKDSKQNILIIPETETKFLFYFSRIRRVIWWLSVDNYFHHSIELACNFLQNYKFYVKPLPKFFYFNNHGDKVFHLAQSCYAKYFLELNGVRKENIGYLSDYLRKNYYTYYSTLKSNKSTQSGRNKVVLFNPKKGLNFTKKIIRLSKNITFVPICDLTIDQIIKLLRTSMIYIDFGEHPGKDRIPREAVIMGMCILVGKKGSALFYEDVPIPEQYKFDSTEDKIPLILNCINDIFNNFEVHSDNFNFYREVIMLEPKIFNEQINNIFTTVY